MDVSVPAAFGFGLLSFLSPCVLPLVPGYISMLSGIGVDQLRQGDTPRNNVMSSAIAFVLGLSIVFMTLGASASAVGYFLRHHRTLMMPIAGAIIILFALQLLGALERIRWSWGLPVAALLIALGIVAYLRPASLRGISERVHELSWGWIPVFGPLHFFSLAAIPLLGPLLARWMNRDIRFRNLGGRDAKKEPSAFSGMVSSFLMGFAFAFGWTGCLGPVIGGVLLLAEDSHNVARGIFLLAIYSAGLAIPFLLTALGISQFMRFYQRFRKYLHAVELVSGVLLLFVGYLIFSNKFLWLTGQFSFLNRFAG